MRRVNAFLFVASFVCLAHSKEPALFAIDAQPTENKMGVGYSYQCRIKNISELSQVFVEWTCTVETNWKTDSKEIQIYQWGCRENMPFSTTLKPQEEITRGIIAQTKKDVAPKKPVRFRLGFTPHRPESDKNGLVLPKEESFTIAWSNELTIDSKSSNTAVQRTPTRGRR